MSQGVGSKWWLNEENFEVVTEPDQPSMVETLEAKLTALKRNEKLQIPKKYFPSLAPMYKRLGRKGYQMRTAVNGHNVVLVWIERGK